jgi:hypothetical protein
MLFHHECTGIVALKDISRIAPKSLLYRRVTKRQCGQLLSGFCSERTSGFAEPSYKHYYSEMEKAEEELKFVPCVNVERNYK